jgi:hypothetical protein
MTQEIYDLGTPWPIKLTQLVRPPMTLAELQVVGLEKQKENLVPSLQEIASNLRFGRAVANNAHALP